MCDTSSPYAERRVRGFCPEVACDQKIEALSFRELSGINDDGVLIAECNSCKAPLSIAIINPGDASLSGASKLRIEDEGAADLPPQMRDQALVFLQMVEEPLHDAGSYNLFRCDSCGEPAEVLVQRQLASDLSAINDELINLHAYYLKAMFPDPAFSVVRGTATCHCEAELSYTTFRKFRPNTPHILAPHDLLIAAIEGAQNFEEIDGVFSRDDCEALVTKLMHRWRLLYPSTVVATPFVGFSFANKEKYRDIWDRLLSLVDPKSVTLITRKRTITEFRQASEVDGVDFEILQRYGLLHSALSHYVKENRFHAKFYAAVDVANDRVEALIGSFNFQEGAALENLSLRTFSDAQFQRRYLTPLGVPDPLPRRDAPYCVVVDVAGGKARAMTGLLSEINRPPSA